MDFSPANLTPETLLLGLTWYVVFLFSTTCHEAAHAWAAKLGGDLTAFHGGQVTLSPVPHIRREPFGMVLIPLATFFLSGWMMGWASAPYDPDWQRKHPHRAAWMALAGPAANLTIALVAAAGLWIGLSLGFFVQPESVQFSRIVESSGSAAGEAASTILSLAFSLNILLAAFNLLPVPPLDGFTGVGLLMSEDKARQLSEAGRSFRQISFLGLFLGWRLFGAIYDPIFTMSLKVIYPHSSFH